MRTFKILLFFVVIVQYCAAQKVVRYYYRTDEVLTKNEDRPTFGKLQNFSTVRTYLDNAQFKETRLLTFDNNKSIHYKIINQIWYYMRNKKWELFYDFYHKKGGVVYLEGRAYNVVFNKEVIIQGETLHKLFFNPVKIFQSHKLAYFFTPKLGIVMIQNSANSVLLRTDCFIKKLTTEELRIL